MSKREKDKKEDEGYFDDHGRSIGTALDYTYKPSNSFETGDITACATWANG